ncbi:hypothetical protein ACOSQ3_016570 [Xanthoceras sorbifolium]
MQEGGIGKEQKPLVEVVAELGQTVSSIVAFSEDMREPTIPSVANKILQRLINLKRGWLSTQPPLSILNYYFILDLVNMKHLQKG